MEGNFYILDPRKPADEAEWTGAWDVAVPGPDKEEYNASGYESWQYMGSTNRRGRWEHEFRHRCHPKTNNRLYRAVTASPGFVARMATESEPLG